MATVIVCSDFGAQENKIFYCFHCFPICMQVKKQQLELDMEQPTDSKLGKEYIEAVI